MDLLNSDFSTTHNLLKTKKISAQEIAAFYSDRIQKLDSKLNSYTYLNPKLNEQALEIDKKIARGQDLPVLSGVLFGIKI